MQSTDENFPGKKELLHYQGIRQDKRKTGEKYTVILHKKTRYTLFTLLDAGYACRLFEEEGILLADDASSLAKGYYSKVSLALQDSQFCIVKKMKQTVIDSQMPNSFWELIQWENGIGQYVKKIKGLLAANAMVITEDKQGKPLALLFMRLINGNNLSDLMNFISLFIKEDVLLRKDLVALIAPLIANLSYDAPAVFVGNNTQSCDSSEASDSDWSDEEDSEPVVDAAPQRLTATQEQYTLLKLQNILLIYSIHALLPTIKAMHTQKIFHRDIHAGNVLLSWQEAEVLLCDFGSAVVLNNTLLSRKHVYFQCAAPEWYFMTLKEREEALNNNAWLNAQLDMWQWGCMLASCLEGGQNLYEFLLKIKPGEVGSFTKQPMACEKQAYLHHLQTIINKELQQLFIRNNVPYALQEIIQGLLHPNVKKRFHIVDVEQRLLQLPWISKASISKLLSVLRHVKNPDLVTAAKNPAAFFSQRLTKLSSAPLAVNEQLQVS